MTKNITTAKKKRNLHFDTYIKKKDYDDNNN